MYRSVYEGERRERRRGSRARWSGAEELLVLIVVDWCARARRVCVGVRSRSRLGLAPRKPCGGEAEVGVVVMVSVRNIPAVFVLSSRLLGPPSVLVGMGLIR
jgi:hypothetical protein